MVVATELVRGQEVVSPNDALAPIEHFLMGSSVDYQGELLTGSEFYRRLDAGGIVVDDTLFVPFAVARTKENIATAQQVRSGRQYIAGFLSCFDTDSQMELLDKRFLPALELPSLDPESGGIEPKWRVRLKTTNANLVLSNVKILKKLKVRDSTNSHLEFRLNGGEFYLRFHL